MKLHSLWSLVVYGKLITTRWSWWIDLKCSRFAPRSISILINTNYLPRCHDGSPLNSKLTFDLRYTEWAKEICPTKNISIRLEMLTFRSSMTVVNVGYLTPLINLGKHCILWTYTPLLACMKQVLSIKSGLNIIRYFPESRGKSLLFQNSSIFHLL